MNPLKNFLQNRSKVTAENPEKNEILVAGAMKLAVLDKAGTKIVAGDHW